MLLMIDNKQLFYIKIIINKQFIFFVTIVALSASAKIRRIEAEKL